MTIIIMIPDILCTKKCVFEGSLVAFQLSNVFQHHLGAMALTNPSKKTITWKTNKMVEKILNPAGIVIPPKSFILILSYPPVDFKA